jgi:hypothetical protein
MKGPAIGATLAIAVLCGAVTASGGAGDTPQRRHARTYYVDPRGSDTTGAGTQLRPWHTLAHACESTPGELGDTINLRGSGAGATTLKGTADPLVSVRDCMHAANVQALSDLRLDGKNRSAGTFGVRATRTRGLTITRIMAQGFRGPRRAGGGAIDIEDAWGLELDHSVLRNSGYAGRRTCSGTLGLGNLHDSRIHDLVINDSRANGIVATNSRGLRRPSMTNVQFYNLTVYVRARSCAKWNSLSFELFETDATNVQIRNSTFNRTVSLTDPGSGTPLSSGYRYWIHNNVFSEGTSGSNNNYAIELDNNNSIIDHNYFDGGLYPIANFTGDRKTGNIVDHNVFDHQYFQTAAMHITAGVLNAKFTKNTVVLREQSWLDGVFSFAEMGFQNSTIDIKDNIFLSAYPIGNKLGLGLGAATIDRNAFHNISAAGTNAVTADPQMSLAGGFPSAYVPTSSSALGLGAFADGSWSAGVRRHKRVRSAPD